MSTALRPVLRTSTLPISSAASSPSLPTYIHQPVRHARLLRRPKRPYTFTQLITLSDGSAFTLRTTSPQPVYRSTRDTRNTPLWNPSSKELLNIEDDESGRLSGFRARFGKRFDLQREGAATEEQQQEVIEGAEEGGKGEGKAKVPGSSGPFFQSVTQTKAGQVVEEDEYYGFEEDDASLLDLISEYGQDTKKDTDKKGGKK